MRPLRFASTAALLAAVLATPLALAQTPPPAAPPPPAAATPPAAALPPATETEKSEALKRLEERLHALGQGQGGITANEVARRTLVASPTIEAQKHAVAAADAAVSQAKAGYVPQVVVSANYTRLSDIGDQSLGDFNVVGTPAPEGLVPATAPLIAFPLQFATPLNNYTLAARLTVPISDYFLRVGPSVAAANRQQEAARFDAAAARNDLVRDSRLAYYNWVRAQANALITQQALDQASGHYSDAKNSFDAGLGSKADVLRVDTEVRGAQAAVERTKHLVDLAAIRLSVLMGDRPGAQYVAGEDVFAPAPELDRLPTPAAAYSEAIAKRPELKALEKVEAALREQAKIARAANYPRLDAQASAMYANPNQRYFPLQDEFHGSWDAGATLSWIPTDIPGAQAQTSIIEARAMEVAANRRAFYEGLRLDVNQVLRVAEEARFEIGVSRDATASAEEGYRVRRELFRAGRATTVEVTDAEASLTRARSAYVDAHIAARVALAELRHSIGRDATMDQPKNAPPR
jgi:outer membrane protein TolC